jgi:hypothetical protein
VIISSNGLRVENSDALAGNPAVTIEANDVTFVNKSGGSVIGQPAIRITGAGATIVNEAGGLIRGASDMNLRFAFLAIDGSDFDDTVINTAGSSTTSC